MFQQVAFADPSRYLSAVETRSGQFMPYYLQSQQAKHESIIQQRNISTNAVNPVPVNTSKKQQQEEPVKLKKKQGGSAATPSTPTQTMNETDQHFIVETANGRHAYVDIYENRNNNQELIDSMIDRISELHPATDIGVIRKNIGSRMDNPANNFKIELCGEQMYLNSLGIFAIKEGTRKDYSLYLIKRENAAVFFMVRLMDYYPADDPVFKLAGPKEKTTFQIGESSFALNFNLEQIVVPENNTSPDIGPVFPESNFRFQPHGLDKNFDKSALISREVDIPGKGQDHFETGTLPREDVIDDNDGTADAPVCLGTARVLPPETAEQPSSDKETFISILGLVTDRDLKEMVEEILKGLGVIYAEALDLLEIIKTNYMGFYAKFVSAEDPEIGGIEDIYHVVANVEAYIALVKSGKTDLTAKEAAEVLSEYKKMRELTDEAVAQFINELRKTRSAFKKLGGVVNNSNPQFFTSWENNRFRALISLKEKPRPKKNRTEQPDKRPDQLLQSETN